MRNISSLSAGDGHQDDIDRESDSNIIDHDDAARDISLRAGNAKNMQATAATYSIRTMTRAMFPRCGLEEATMTI